MGVAYDMGVVGLKNQSADWTVSLWAGYMVGVASTDGRGQCGVFCGRVLKEGVGWPVLLWAWLIVGVVYDGRGSARPGGGGPRTHRPAGRRDRGGGRSARGEWDSLIPAGLGRGSRVRVHFGVGRIRRCPHPYLHPVPSSCCCCCCCCQLHHLCPNLADSPQVEPPARAPSFPSRKIPSSCLGTLRSCSP